jgi:probable rRNA maturation factor
VKLKVNVQYACRAPGLPAKRAIVRWVQAALTGCRRKAVEIGVRIVGEQEIAALNRRFRGKRGPTNVLSFPLADPPGVQTGFLGDIVVCAPVVMREARVRATPLRAHWAHMLVHGIMHLRGYDHQTPAQADEMESMEGRILKRLGFSNPYG